MEIQPERSTTKADADHFIGDAWYDVIAYGEGESRIRVNSVHFAPGARNAWHAHTLGQTLHVTQGRGRIQARGGAILEIGPGDTIHLRPSGAIRSRMRNTTA